MPEPVERSSSILKLQSLMEKLADVEHERWSHWQRYMHSKCERSDDGSLVIPAHLVDRWESQMNTPYSGLSEEEKESDREQVRRYLSIIADAFKPVP
jgi:RyR domain